MTTKTVIIDMIRKHKQDLEHLGVHKVGLFASYLHDNPSENSDIDILLDFVPEKENFDNYMKACDLIEDLFDNEKVEVITKNGLSPYIGPKILNEVMYV